MPTFSVKNRIHGVRPAGVVADPDCVNRVLAFFSQNTIYLTPFYKQDLSKDWVSVDGVSQFLFENSDCGLSASCINTIVKYPENPAHYFTAAEKTAEWKTPGGTWLTPTGVGRFYSLYPTCAPPPPPPPVTLHTLTPDPGLILSALTRDCELPMRPWASDSERSAWKAAHPGCPEPPPFEAPGANDANLPAGPSTTTLVVGAVAIAGLAWFFTR